MCPHLASPEVRNAGRNVTVIAHLFSPPRAKFCRVDGLSAQVYDDGVDDDYVGWGGDAPAAGSWVWPWAWPWPGSADDWLKVRHSPFSSVQPSQHRSSSPSS